MIESIIKILQLEMETPKPYGWFHLMWIAISFIIIFILYKLRNKYSEKQLKIVLGVYGIIVFILELLKQISWAYDINTNTWNYSWYSAPFQLCTMPIYVSLICLFLKKSKVRDYLLSFICFYTILGSIATMIMPDTCFVKDILVNYQNMINDKEYDKELLGELNVYDNIQPNRKNCALIPSVAVEKMLEELK